MPDVTMPSAEGGDWAIPPERTLAYVMARVPIMEIEGLWFLTVGAFEWDLVPYEYPHVCEHYPVTLCRDCQESWYYLHNIRLQDVENPESWIDFDRLVAEYNAAQGIPEPPLAEVLELWFG